MHESFESKSLHFVGEINHRSVNDFVEHVKQYTSGEDRNEISILMSTGGGVTSAAIFMHDFLRCQPFRITMIASGPVDSAGIYPFLAGDRRIALPSASFLFHPSTIEMSGRYRKIDLSEQIRIMDSEDQACCEIVVSRTSMTADIHAALVSERTRITSERAVELGIVGAVAAYNDKPS